MKTKHWDVIVVGGGLSGWLTARSLSQRGQKVAIVESASKMGGTTQSFGVIPESKENRSALAFMESATNLLIAGDTLENPPVSFEKGALSPFVGFGETPPPEVDEVSWYAQFSRIELLHPVQEWLEALQKDFSGDSFIKSQVTHFNIEGGKVISVEINGDKTLAADRFVFAGHPQDFPHLCAFKESDQHLAPKFVQKLSRGQLWTAVSLQLTHAESVTTEKGMHVLMGGGETAKVCIGLFNGNHSQWMTFLTSDESDEDLTATALREVKRQMKRVYPHALENLAWEKIIVSPRSHGQIPMKDDRGSHVPGIENIWLVSGLLHPSRNIPGVIERVRLVLDGMATTDLRPIQPENSAELAL